MDRMKKNENDSSHLIKTVLYSSLISLFLYLNLFGNTGLFSRNKLLKQKEKLENLQNNLKKDGKLLQQRFLLLQDDNAALELEAKKYLLLSEKSRILRFKEDKNSISNNPNKTEKNDKLVIASNTGKKQSSIQSYRITYILLSILLIATFVLIDWKRKTKKTTLKEKHILFQ